MEFEAIKQELKANSCSIAIIARSLNKSHTAVTDVAKGVSTSKTIAKAICVALNRPIKEVFPDKPSYHTSERFNSKSEQNNYWQSKLAS